MDSLEQLIESVKRNLSQKENVYQNEASVREQIVMPVLRYLGWITTDPNTVSLEYSVNNRRSETRKIDYALFAQQHSEAPNLIIEVKAVGKVDADDQLFEYAFITGVALAILTDGKEWRVYLPMSHGSMQERLVRTIDLLHSDVVETSEALRQFMSFENISSGKSFEFATQISKEKKNQELAKSKISEAWTNLTTGEDARIVDLIIEETSRLSGIPPRLQDVEKFLTCMTSQPDPVDANLRSKDSAKRRSNVFKKAHLQVNLKSTDKTKSRENKVTYWLFNEKHEVNHLTAAYREIMNELVRHVPQDRLQQIKFIYRDKMDITQSHRKRAERLSNGMYIHTYTDSKKKLKQLETTCKAASIDFGTKSGLLLDRY